MNKVEKKKTVPLFVKIEITFERQKETSNRIVNCIVVYRLLRVSFFFFKLKIFLDYAKMLEIFFFFNRSTLEFLNDARYDGILKSPKDSLGAIKERNFLL